MLAARSLLVVSVAVSLLVMQNAAAQTVGWSASGASTVSGGEYTILELGFACSCLTVHRSRSRHMGKCVTFPALAAMGGLIQQFAASQSQSQLGLASQAFGLNSGSNSHPFLNGSTSDCKFTRKPLSFFCGQVIELMIALQPVHWALP